VDPGQRHDVAAAHPGVVAELRAAYERWWADLSPRFGEYCEIVLGSEHENPTQLTCHDWHGELAPSPQESVKKRVIANGFWAVLVARPGTYEITLREQPAVANFPIGAATARLSVGGTDVSQPVPHGATAVTFRVRLEAGPARLQTWLTEANGTSRGAYYVEVRRVEEMRERTRP